MKGLFLSKYLNNLDKKGRVSIPPQYRTILTDQRFNGLIAYPSIKHDCIEACSLSKIEKVYDMINNLDPYSEIRDSFETIMLGGSHQISFDKEGRVILPNELIK